LVITTGYVSFLTDEEGEDYWEELFVYGHWHLICPLSLSDKSGAVAP
jgi:hypothetical protein